MFELDWKQWLLIIALSAFGTVGLLEWVKGFFKDADKKIWRFVMPVIAIGIGLLYLYVKPVFFGVTIVAFCQLCYSGLKESGSVILETILRKLGE